MVAIAGYIRGLLLRAKGSLWLIPSAAIMVAVLLAFGLVEADAEIGARLAQSWPRFFGAGAEGARGMLSAIAASMITVAGVVFSVTIVALSLAASAYSPRILRTFLHDRLTQTSFGVFVGIFVYCLVVLRTVRAAGEGMEFVPSIAVAAAVVLAVGGVWVLVYFIHHLAVAIQVSSILERVATETRGSVDRLFPQRVANDSADDMGNAAFENRWWRNIPARHTGYVVQVNLDGLAEFAQNRGAVLRMQLAVGEFAIEGQPLVAVTGDNTSVDADADAVDAHFSFAEERTIDQDVEFGIQQIVDVAARALSPAINSPSTAILCLDHLTAIFMMLGQRRIGARRYPDKGAVRVFCKGPTFESIASTAFGPLARYAAGKREIEEHLVRKVRMIERTLPPDRRMALRRCIEPVRAAVNDCVVYGTNGP